MLTCSILKNRLGSNWPHGTNKRGQSSHAKYQALIGKEEGGTASYLITVFSSVNTADEVRLIIDIWVCADGSEDINRGRSASVHGGQSELGIRRSCRGKGEQIS